MNRLHTALAALCLVSLSVRAAADVRVVAPSGAPWTEIQAALDAANDGDVVLVRTGTYSSFVIRNQDVVVVADTGADVRVVGAIRVGGVGATRTAVVSGLRATGSQSPNAVTHNGFIAQNCTGAVRVFGCQLTGVPLSPALPVCAEGQGAFLDSCSDVAFVGCTLTGSTAPPRMALYNSIVPDASTADGGHGVYSDASTAALYDSSLAGGMSGLGGYFGPSSCGVPPNGTGYGYVGISGEGYRGTGSFVFASNVTFTGAQGWPAGCWWPSCGCGCGNSGGNALVHGGAAANAFRFGCTTTGGMGGLHWQNCPCGISVGNCGPGCCGGFNCTMPSGAAVVGTVTTLSGSRRQLSASPRVARPGNVVSLLFQGQPGDRVELLVGDRTRFQLRTAQRGVLLVRQGRPALVQQVGTIGPGGSLTQTWTLGSLAPGEQARVVWMQALMTDVSGQTTLSSPAMLTIVAPGY